MERTPETKPRRLDRLQAARPAYTVHQHSGDHQHRRDDGARRLRCDAALSDPTTKSGPIAAEIDLYNDNRFKTAVRPRREEAKRYFAKTGIYQINHGMVIRRSIFERYPVGRAQHLQRLRGGARCCHPAPANYVTAPAFRTGTPLATTSRRALATDPMAYGVKGNQQGAGDRHPICPRTGTDLAPCRGSRRCSRRARWICKTRSWEGRRPCWRGERFSMAWPRWRPPRAARSRSLYPSHTIKIIVPTPAGGADPGDTRGTASSPTRCLPFSGQPIVIENRATAPTTRPARKLRRLPTRTAIPLSNTAASETVMRPMLIQERRLHRGGFRASSPDCQRDAAVFSWANPPMRRSSRWRKELVAYAKANPGKLNAIQPAAPALCHASYRRTFQEADPARRSLMCPTRAADRRWPTSSAARCA